MDAVRPRQVGVGLDVVLEPDDVAARDDLSRGTVGGGRCRRQGRERRRRGDDGLEEHVVEKRRRSRSRERLKRM